MYYILYGDGKKPRFQLHNEIQSVRLTFLDKIIQYVHAHGKRRHFAFLAQAT